MFVLVSCSGAAPDYGTLPRIVVPFEESPAPAPDPTPVPTSPPATRAANVDPPDPPAVTNALELVEFHLRFADGEPQWLASTRLPSAGAELPARRMGRFAVELMLGAELVERVRFDFPLLGSDEQDEAFEKGLTSEARVRVPLVERATRARLLDRKTRRSIELPWPPAP